MENQNTTWYAVISKKFEEETAYYLVDTNEIKTMLMSDTYGSFGESVDSAEAGDTIELLSEKAVQIAEKVHSMHDDEEHGFEVNDHVIAYEYNHYNELLAALESVAKEGEDYNLYQEEVKGFNYWDGSNFASIIVDADCYEAPYELVQDQELVSAINQAVQEKKFQKKITAGEQYRGGEYIIMTSHWAGVWYDYEVVPADEFERMNEY